MGALDAALHAFNFIAPAFFVAILVSWLGGFLKQNKPLARTLIARSAINFIVCLAVLVIGLIFTGRDGKMLSYLAMIVSSATVQWFFAGGWRK